MKGAAIFMGRPKALEQSDGMVVPHSTSPMVPLQSLSLSLRRPPRFDPALAKNLAPLPQFQRINSAKGQFPFAFGQKIVPPSSVKTEAETPLARLLGEEEPAKKDKDEEVVEKEQDGEGVKSEGNEKETEVKDEEKEEMELKKEELEGENSSENREKGEEKEETKQTKEEGNERETEDDEKREASVDEKEKQTEANTETKQGKEE